MPPGLIPTTWPESMSRKEVVLLIFTKTPVPGSVKTRLIPVAGEAKAVTIHTELLRRTLVTARRSSIRDMELWCAPSTRHRMLTGHAENFALALETQAGGDLGERMCYAMEQALQSYDHALLIGSDCVDLAASDIDLALEQLTDGCDVVLGPAWDNGYYLIGLSRLYRQLFTDIEWGTEMVLAQTREKAAQLKLRIHELPRRRDIDRPEDLHYM